MRQAGWPCISVSECGVGRSAGRPVGWSAGRRTVVRWRCCCWQVVGGEAVGSRLPGLSRLSLGLSLGLSRLSLGLSLGLSRLSLRGKEGHVPASQFGASVHSPQQGGS